MAVQGIDPGFKPDGVLTLTTYLPMPQYRLVAAREAYYARVLEDVRALPGVTAAGFVSFLPMSSFRGGIWPVAVKGDAEAARRHPEREQRRWPPVRHARDSSRQWG